MTDQKDKEIPTVKFNVTMPEDWPWYAQFIGGVLGICVMLYFLIGFAIGITWPFWLWMQGN